MDRLDALGKNKSERLAQLTGRILDDGEDPQLDAIVAEAVQATKAPIGLVSLVLERVQLFRSQVGLPPDLVATRSTDRDVSFCQIVVADEVPLEVNGADADGRVPQDLVNRYGIRSYLGMPVRVGEAVVGTLCVVDLVPRSFSAAERADLAALAVKASARLNELAHLPPEPLVHRAANPIFGELRNLLAPLRVHVSLARSSMAELRALKRLAGLTATDPVAAARAAGALLDAGNAFDDLEDSFAEIEQVGTRLDANVLALEKLLVRLPAPARLDEIIHAASQLAEHRTKLVGGVAWPPLPSVRVATASTTAVAVISAALQIVPAPIAPRLHVDGERLSIRFVDAEAPLHAITFGVVEGAELRSADGALVVTLRIQSQQSDGR